MFGLIKKSTCEQLLASVHEGHNQILDRQQEYYEKLLAEEYDKALADTKAQLRELLVDTNYELFNTDDSLLRAKVYAFMAHGLAMFHNRTVIARKTKENEENA